MGIGSLGTRIELGELTLHLVNDGGFRLDGGAMFGVIPKTLWEKVKPADERNRIAMTVNCLLVERGGELLLIDTGLGGGHDAKFRDLFGLEEGAVRLPEAIRRAGFELGDIDHVLSTHLHFDHCGWNTREEGARRVPTFPNARYWIAEGELEHARSPNLRDRASYDPRNWEPLLEAGVVELFRGEAEPINGVRAVEAPGHTRNMAIVCLDGGGARGVFWADLVPTAAHVSYPWIMGFDLFPMQTLEQKQRWLPRAAEEGWLSVFEHDPDVPLGRIVSDRPGRFKAEPVEPPR
jgi:glyoxylase-like metal-dependent hydrolase (beta-lactamase superfamily II)